MRRTRFMSLFFLILAGAFFLLPAFRQAFDFPIAAVMLERGGWDEGGRERAEFERWASEAEQSHDARGMAFAAMHHPVDAERMRLAAAATAADPKLTWIYFSAIQPLKTDNPLRLEGARKLQAWEPQNALGYLLEGEILQARGAKVQWQLPEEAAQQTEWRSVLAKAFAAPVYDTHVNDRFELDRAILLAHGRATPVRMVLYMAAMPIPSLRNIRTYSTVLIKKLGAEAETANKPQEAAAQYWIVARMGERMHLVRGSLLEQLIGTAIQNDAYKALAALLRKQGQADTAAMLDYNVAAHGVMTDTLRGKDPLSASSNNIWTAYLVFVFEALVLVFLAVTLVAVGYVNAKRWVRPQVKGKLYGLMTTTENYAPILLFAFSAGLYLSYYPFFVNFQHYMQAKGPFRDFESFMRNSLPLPEIWFGNVIPIGNPLVPYGWYAIAGLVIVLVAARVTKGSSTDANAQASAAS